MVKVIFFLACCCLLFGRSSGQDSLHVGVNTNIRALSIPQAGHWWFGGSKGWLGHSADCGKTWVLRQPLGNLPDYRSLHAFNETEAVAAVAGKPAVILRTIDGGNSWEEVFRHPDSTAFFDGFGFWNEREGVLFGDPLSDGRLLLLFTHDGGRTWQAAPDSMRPLFAFGEAAFAASGTSLQCAGDSTMALVSGGHVSRLWYTRNRGRTWTAVAGNLPNHLLHQPQPKSTDILPPEKAVLYYGTSSRGGFSLAFAPDGQWVVVGGDYLNESHAQGHLAVFFYGYWWQARIPTRAYRESALVLKPLVWLATGPTGTDITRDGGLTWQALNDYEGMHVAKNDLAGGFVLAGRGGVLWHYQRLEPFVNQTWKSQTALGKRIYQNDLRLLERKPKKKWRKNRKAKMDANGNADFSHTNQALADLLEQTEGIARIWVDSCKRFPALVPGYGSLGFEVNTQYGPVSYSFSYRLNKTLPHGHLRRKLGLAVTRNELSEPKLQANPFGERMNHIECFWPH